MSFAPLLPVTNATVTEIHPPAIGDGYRGDAAAAASRWSGTSRAFLDQTLDTSRRGQDTDEVEPTTLALETAAGLDVARGERLTFALDGGSPQTRTVRGVKVLAPGLTFITFNR